MTFDERYPHARTTEAPPPHWPKGVRPVSIDGMGLLGVGDDGHVYWDGRQIRTGTRIQLSGIQASFAIAAAVAVVTVATLDLLRFLGLGS
jgi:hypothetical protein